LSKAKKPSPPHVQANVTLVEHGYQIDVSIDGKWAATECRDFVGHYTLHELKKVVTATLLRAIDDIDANVEKIRAALKPKRKR
jgi:hypothetical protein